MDKKTKRLIPVAYCGLGVALAFIMSYVELLIPPLYPAIPGIKMGLANIIIIFLLYRSGPTGAATVSLLRILLINLFFGNAMMLFYSLAGGLLSLLGMMLLKKIRIFSTVGVSIAGGVLHNVGQILMAMLLLETAQLGYYLAVLVVTGTLSGTLIGLCGALLIKRIPQKN